MTDRIYLVRGPNNSKQLVRAKSRSAAVKVVVDNDYTVAPATTMEVADVMAGGGTVIAAASPPPSDPS